MTMQKIKAPYNFFEVNNLLEPAATDDNGNKQVNR